MDLTKITLSTGTTHIVSHSPEEVYQRIAHSDGKPKNHIHLFNLESGQEIYINATYILSVEKVDSHGTTTSHQKNQEDNSADKVEDSKRIKNNLEAVKEFKEDIDGNME